MTEITTAARRITLYVNANAHWGDMHFDAAGKYISQTEPGTWVLTSDGVQKIMAKLPRIGFAPPCCATA